MNHSTTTPAVMPAASTTTRLPEQRPPRTRRRFRGDIEGLRAVAVGMVLLYHAAPHRLPGGFAGVDVFFVISGFLITGLVVREVEQTGTLSLTRFWARRAKRLLPATALVLLTVALLTHVLLSPLRWITTGADIVAASLYVVNWQLAARSVDYLAADYAPSPVQHFWSLAVEEQFYLVWPVLVLALTVVAARRRLPVRRVLATGLLLLAVPSLIWSIVFSAQDASAYFVTTTRVWELALGAGIALSARRLERLPATVAAALTWIGLVGLVACAFVLHSTLPWPGSAALLPTVATGLVIAGGAAAGGRGAGVVLGIAPMRAVGALSYSLYLWHWPLIVMATPTDGRLSAKVGLLVVLLSFIPAYLSYRLVERPIHHAERLDRRPRQALAVGLICTLIGVGAGWWLRSALPAEAAAGEAPGAAVLALSDEFGKAVDTSEAIVPDPLVARADLPELYARGCQSGYDSAEVVPCEFGNATSSKVVYLVGDSKAAQWLPAVQALATEHDWRVVSITKSGCPLADVTVVKGQRGSRLPYTSCTEWNQGVMQLLLHDGPRPDLVVTTTHAPYHASVDGKVLERPESRQAISAGLRTTWQELNDAGIPVAAIRETPAMQLDVAECTAANRDHLTACAVDQDDALRFARTVMPAAEDLAGVAGIDLTESGICPHDPCAAVIGNMLVYRDANHLTARYAETLAPMLETKLRRAWDDVDVPGGVTDLWAS